MPAPMSDVASLDEPSTINLNNPTYLTLAWDFLPPEDMLSCALVCKQWSAEVSHTWDSLLQRVSQVLHNATVPVINPNQALVPSELLIKRFALSEYKLRKDANSLPITNYYICKRASRRLLKKQSKRDGALMLTTIKRFAPSEYKLQKDAYCLPVTKYYDCKRPSRRFSKKQVERNGALMLTTVKSLYPPALKLKDLLLVVHVHHVPTQTPVCSALWNMDEIAEAGLVYGKEAPILTKEVDFRVPLESLAQQPNDCVVPLGIFSEGPGEYDFKRQINAVVSVQMYRRDTGKVLRFERAKIMSVPKYSDDLVGRVRTHFRKSTSKKPDCKHVYPSIGFEVGFGRRGQTQVLRSANTHKVCRHPISVSLRYQCLPNCPGHNRMAIQWQKKELGKHFQYMDWE